MHLIDVTLSAHLPNDQHEQHVKPPPVLQVMYVARQVSLAKHWRIMTTVLWLQATQSFMSDSLSYLVDRDVRVLTHPFAAE